MVKLQKNTYCLYSELQYLNMLWKFDINRLPLLYSILDLY